MAKVQIDITCQQHLRSASCHQLFVPHYRRSMFCRRAVSFSVAGPMVWNLLLPDILRDPTCSLDSFRCDLKSFLFSVFYSAQSALQALHNYAQQHKFVIDNNTDIDKWKASKISYIRGLSNGTNTNDLE